MKQCQRNAGGYGGGWCASDLSLGSVKLINTVDDTHANLKPVSLLFTPLKSDRLK